VILCLLYKEYISFVKKTTQNHMLYRNYFKRILDILVSIGGIILLLPIIVLLAFIITLVTKTNPLFLQERTGAHGTVFIMFKFRTMSNKKSKSGNLLPDDQRLTKLGKWLRKSSLDEVPQLLNILKGDMSLIGPRPLLPTYLPLYSVQQNKRHAIKPGITGWAQVNGRNTLPWEQKFELDIWYVDNLSLRIDLKIFYKTIITVLRGEGINAKGNLSVPAFTGKQLS
jgi:undecaprenyl phosphate N,N'-diacetylbacillosamine 1-phosphate transferase